MTSTLPGSWSGVTPSPTAARADLPGVELTRPLQTSGLDATVAATRRVMAALLHAGNNSAAELDALTAQLNAVAGYLETHAPDFEERFVDMWSAEGLGSHDPAAGTHNAIAPPLRMWGQPDGSVVGRITLGIAYQGPPGLVHGGICALLLDHAMGMANHWAGTSGMTGTLTVRYERPTPLFRELEVRARQLRVQGRRIEIEASIRDGDQVCVVGQGQFVNVVRAASAAAADAAESVFEQLPHRGGGTRGLRS